MDLRTFNILCRYILSSSAYLRINHIVSLQKLIYNLNPETYENDIEKLIESRRSTTSGILNTMEKNNLIKRVDSKKDARKKQIVLMLILKKYL